MPMPLPPLFGYALMADRRCHLSTAALPSRGGLLQIGVVCWGAVWCAVVRWLVLWLWSQRGASWLPAMQRRYAISVSGCCLSQRSAANRQRQRRGAPKIADPCFGLCHCHCLCLCHLARKQTVNTLLCIQALAVSSAVLPPPHPATTLLNCNCNFVALVMLLLQFLCVYFFLFLRLLLLLALTRLQVVNFH